MANAKAPQLRVLVIGEHGPLSGGELFSRELQRAGCDVSSFDYVAEFARFFGTANRLPLQLFYEFTGLTRFNRHLQERIDPASFDVILVLKGLWLTPNTIRDIKQRNTRAILCSFNGDDPFNFTAHGSSHPRVVKAIPEYDLHFTWSQSLIDRLRAAGARRCEWLPWAWDPQTHHAVSITPEQRQRFGATVSFIGNWDMVRESWLDPLARCNDIDFAIWGTNYWKNRCGSRACRRRWRGRQATGNEMAAVINASLMNLNILRAQNTGSHNMRTFEIPGCGGFMIANRTPEHADFFIEGHEYAAFDSPDEMVAKVRYYLQHPDEAMACAARGHEKAKSHTYAHRVQQMMACWQRLRDS